MHLNCHCCWYRLPQLAALKRGTQGWKTCAGEYGIWHARRNRYTRLLYFASYKKYLTKKYVDKHPLMAFYRCITGDISYTSYMNCLVSSFLYDQCQFWIAVAAATFCFLKLYYNAD